LVVFSSNNENIETARRKKNSMHTQRAADHISHHADYYSGTLFCLAVGSDIAAAAAEVRV